MPLQSVISVIIFTKYLVVNMKFYRRRY